MFEAIDNRVLGAFRFVSGVTGLPVTEPLHLKAPQLTLKRNASGWWVVFAAEGLEAHTQSFHAAPATPALQSQSYAIDVRDPAGLYASRRFTLKLPRDPDPAHALQEGSLFQPLAVRLLPSPASPLQASWATVRVTLRRASDQARIAGALVRVLPALPGAAVGRGLTDNSGEAVVSVPGIPRLMAASEGDAVVTNQVDANLAVIVDAAAARFVADADVFAARVAAQRGIDAYPDPDDLETRAAQLAQQQQAIQLSSGGSLSLSMTVNV